MKQMEEMVHIANKTEFEYKVSEEHYKAILLVTLQKV